jgi:uncharacterized protein (DUF1697 family)
MQRYVAFLRGMNLGGRRIENEELKKRFGDLGFSEVACFRASGNVVFTVEEKDEAKLRAVIEAGLARSLGYEVPVGKLQVSLLRKKPSATSRRTVLAMSTDDDRLAIEGRELYWLPSGGMLDSSLDLKAIESLLDRSTRRTKATIDQIVAKHFAG